MSRKVSIFALSGVSKHNDALVERLDVAVLDVGVDVLCHLYGRVSHKVLRDLGRDACLFEPRRVGVAQDVRRNVKAELGTDCAKIALASSACVIPCCLLNFFNCSPNSIVYLPTSFAKYILTHY